MPEPAQPKRKITFLHTLVPLLGRLFLLFTGKTTRLCWIRDEQAGVIESGSGNYIYAIWHSRQVFLIYSHRFRNICALVSQSKDGEYMARLLACFGFDTVRGSTSKGGTAAMLGLLDKTTAGQHPVITPDGPRGPQRNVQSGVLLLAQKTGFPVLPVSCGLSRKITFRSWDMFQLPLPFGKAVVIYGKPLRVGENDNLELKAEKLRLELDRITDQADKLALS